MSSVAFLIPTIDRIGGAERQVLLLARGLAARGWRVTVIALSGTGGAQVESLRAHGIGFLSLRMRKGLADPRGWIALNRWLRGARPDVLHAHLPHAAWMTRWSRLFAPVRVVVDTIHTAGTGSYGRKVGYRISSRFTDAVTVVSHGAAHAWLEARMVPRDKLRVVPNGVDTRRWKPDSAVRMEMRERLGVGDEFLWFAAGRLEAVKDFPMLLRAFAGLPDDARLMIAGDGSLRSELQSLSEALGVSERVRLAGYVDEITPWMQAADGFVLSSLWEGLPMSLLEAGACALPAVSTAVAGAAEILCDAQKSFLSRVGDCESLRAAMLRLMQLPAAEREEIGLRARLHVQKRYGMGPVLDRWEALYVELLQRGDTRQHGMMRVASFSAGEVTHGAEKAGDSKCDADAGAR